MALGIAHVLCCNANFVGALGKVITRRHAMLGATLECTDVQVVYEWACGTAFGEICMRTSVMEGSIVRAIVRLAEATREVLACPAAIAALLMCGV